ncbi:AbrB/MazE/SpoVT family DNA-binding domain-containing protein [Vreelandella rituensis]|uniref:AbrB/MazE/SpoVT family DNA-binding domain-containing protein n=1 Tax=Vreelandella rituensis TaxID=2282306 RepID=A0A368TTR3_9GAMM|nr:AbrB/MazE/SpoVT family DNA-binding domain-containing protein [Halomonas rituensis]RCV88135.1 AbrB/MazE/SpoVT family DNA-binding domain-containing protein [Halomonas rituensis]
MSTTHLRRVGGSVMMSVPRAFLDQLHLDAGSPVEIEIEHGRLIMVPAKPTYSLEELLAQCDTTAEMPADEREWLDSGPAGRELL